MTGDERAGMGDAEKRGMGIKKGKAEFGGERGQGREESKEWKERRDLAWRGVCVVCGYPSSECSAVCSAAVGRVRCGARAVFSRSVSFCWPGHSGTLPLTVSVSGSLLCDGDRGGGVRHREKRNGKQGSRELRSANQRPPLHREALVFWGMDPVGEGREGAMTEGGHGWRHRNGTITWRLF
jgi:hypothetical protein